MKQDFTSNHWRDELGNPEGGCAFGPGFCVSWQRGPLGRDENRVSANGAFVETLLGVVADRLLHYQESKFACADNEEALAHIEKALLALDRRTKAREERKVEGTLKV
jgi:hypothetical protein